MIDKGYYLRGNLSKVKGTTGWYRWWFPENLFNQYLSQINPKCKLMCKLRTMTIDDNVYVCLYIGIAVGKGGLKKRLRNHLNGPFKNSTLRRTIRAILSQYSNVMIPAQAVDSVLDNCYCEYEYTTIQKARCVEKSELSQTDYCYPLNIQGNKTMPHEWIEELKKMRKALVIKC